MKSNKMFILMDVLGVLGVLSLIVCLLLFDMDTDSFDLSLLRGFVERENDLVFGNAVELSDIVNNTDSVARTIREYQKARLDLEFSKSFDDVEKVIDWRKAFVDLCGGLKINASSDYIRCFIKANALYDMFILIDDRDESYWMYSTEVLNSLRLVEPGLRGTFNSYVVPRADVLGFMCAITSFMCFVVITVFIITTVRKVFKEKNNERA